MTNAKYQSLAKKFFQIEKSKGSVAANEFLDEFKGRFAARIGIAIAVELMFEKYEINKKSYV